MERKKILNNFDSRFCPFSSVGAVCYGGRTASNGGGFRHFLSSYRCQRKQPKPDQRSVRQYIL